MSIDTEVAEKIVAEIVRSPGPFSLVRAICAHGYALVPVEVIERFPEINPSNYDHDDACTLNAWGVEVVNTATM